jgi:hypothetical protein
MDKRTLLLLAVVLFVPLSGCDTGHGSWTLEGGVEDVSQVESGYNVSVSVSLQGDGDGVQISGVKAVFLSEDSSVLTEKMIGGMTQSNSSRSRRFSVVTSQRPHFIHLKYRSVEQPGGASGAVVGFRLTGEQRGEYRYLTYSDYDPEY